MGSGETWAVGNRAAGNIGSGLARWVARALLMQVWYAQHSGGVKSKLQSDIFMSINLHV